MNQHQFFALMHLISTWGSLYLATASTNAGAAALFTLIAIFYSMRMGMAVRRYKKALAGGTP